MHPVEEFFGERCTAGIGQYRIYTAKGAKCGFAVVRVFGHESGRKNITAIKATAKTAFFKRRSVVRTMSVQRVELALQLMIHKKLKYQEYTPKEGLRYF